MRRSMVILVVVLACLLVIALWRTLWIRGPARAAGRTDTSEADTEEERDDGSMALDKRRVHGTDGWYRCRGQCVSVISKAPVPAAVVRLGAASAVAGVDGTFVIEADGEQEITVSAKGYEPAVWAVPRDGNVGVVYLIPLPRVGGVVLLPTGAAAPHATVSVVGEQRVLASTETDSDGMFDAALCQGGLELLTEGRHTVLAIAFLAGYSPAWTQMKAAGDRLTLQLAVPSASVAGYVFDKSTGVRLGGAQLWLRSSSARLSLQGAFPMAVSREDGTFDVQGLPAGALEWQLLASHAGYVAGSIRTKSTEGPIPVGLWPSCTVDGTTQWNDGSPASGATIQVEFSPNPDDDGVTAPTQSSNVTSDESGRFRLDGIPRSWPITIKALLGASRAVAEVSTPSSAPVQLTLSRSPDTRCVAVRTVDEAGRAVSGQRVVFATRAANEGPWIPVATVASDPHGYASMYIATQFSGYCIATADGGGMTGMTEAPIHVADWPPEGLTLILSRTVAIRGRLSELPAGGDTSITCWAYDGTAVPHCISTASPGPTGTFAVSAAHAPACLCVVGANIVPVQIRFTTEPQERLHDVGTVPMVRAESISGTVVGRSGRPVRRVLVRLVVGDDWSLLYPSRWMARTSRAGEFTLLPAPPSDHAPTLVATYGSDPGAISEARCTVGSDPLIVRIDVQ